MEKIAKTLKNDAIFLMIVILIIDTFRVSYVYQAQELIKYIILILISIILPIIIYIGAKRKQHYAGIWGIVYSIFLILSFSLGTILGIFMLIHSIKYIKVYNNEE